MRKYFACSVGEPGKGYVEENFDRIVNNKAFILHQDTAQKGVYNDIEPNDIILLKYNNHFVGYGEVIERKTTNDPEWNLWATVKVWYFKDPSNRSVGVQKSGIQENTLEGGGQMGTVKGLAEIFAIHKMKEIDPLTILYKSIIQERIQQKNNKDMNDKIRLLQYKKQIILQGPPGTGKTRLAKALAKEITKESVIKSPLDIINEFFKSSTTVSQKTLDKRKSLEGYLNDFQQAFKKEDIGSLSLERYSFGNGANNSFCWWIEYGLYELGGYTGQAGKFKIFWKKSTDSYSKIGFIKDVEDDSEAMRLVAEQLDNVVNEKSLDQASEKLSKGFILKILHSYYPDKYFPINNEKCINNALKILGQKREGVNVFEKNKALQKAFEAKRKEFNANITNYEFMDFLFLSFDMKGLINIQKEGLISKGDYKLIQFHPAYSYEDFVRGITVETNKNNQIEYKVVNKILCEFAQKAFDNRSAKFVLIIDEINRANLPAVLGELIYALEYRYDESNSEETIVESMYSLKLDKDDEDGDNVLRLPKNLFIIGTMNTADRSVGHIDYAIRRRFAFVDVLPSAVPIHPLAVTLFKKVSELFIKNYDTIDWNNPLPERSDYLASDFRPEDIWIGHSYFITDKAIDEEAKTELSLKRDFEIIPLLKEYLKDGILLEKATDKIKEIKDFVI